MHHVRTMTRFMAPLQRFHMFHHGCLGVFLLRETQIELTLLNRFRNGLARVDNVSPRSCEHTLQCHLVERRRQRRADLTKGRRIDTQLLQRSLRIGIEVRGQVGSMRKKPV